MTSGDGYDPGKIMTPDEAEQYHSWQIALFRERGADLVSAFTITNINEAMGFARAAERADIPCVISFTLETDGRLPTGEELPPPLRLWMRRLQGNRPTT